MIINHYFRPYFNRYIYIFSLKGKKIQQNVDDIVI